MLVPGLRFEVLETPDTERGSTLVAEGRKRPRAAAHDGLPCLGTPETQPPGQRARSSCQWSGGQGSQASGATLPPGLRCPLTRAVSVSPLLPRAPPVHTSPLPFRRRPLSNPEAHSSSNRRKQAGDKGKCFPAHKFFMDVDFKVAIWL